MDEQDEYGGEHPVEEPATLEAYAAHERVKSEMLNLRAMVSGYLHDYIVNTTKRNRLHKKRLADMEAIRNWYLFQASVLSLYKNLKPHLRNKKPTAQMKARFEKLDRCFIDILKYGKELKSPEWVEIAFYLDEVVYDIGVSKIELDKSHQDEFI